MAAAVCGSKRSFFEDLPSSPPVSKRLRCASASASPPRFSSSAAVDRLRTVFPHIEPELLERALEECNNNIDSAIKLLNEQCLGSPEEKASFVNELGANVDQGTIDNDGNAAVLDGLLCPKDKLPVEGAEWVNLFVTEMTSATNMDDAKARASRVLQLLEKSIVARVSDEAAQSFEKETLTLKEQMQILMRENSVLKRAVAIQHERQKEVEGRNQELQHLKQLISQYQEQVRTLEINNYALTMHLRQAQQSSSIPGRFNPDVF